MVQGSDPDVCVKCLAARLDPVGLRVPSGAAFERSRRSMSGLDWSHLALTHLARLSPMASVYIRESMLTTACCGTALHGKALSCSMAVKARSGSPGSTGLCTVHDSQG